MPSDEIMKKFNQGTLHSGSGGPIVKNPAQAIAIKRSYQRKEGDLPMKKGGRGKAFS